MALSFESIERRYTEGEPHYLTPEETVCYVLSAMRTHDMYGTLLIQVVERDPLIRLSDTVLYTALKFLEGNEYIFGYWWKIEGRGRPRRMYRLSRPDNGIIKVWADYWESENPRPVFTKEDLEDILGCEPSFGDDVS